jgi:hypothetical protein
MRMRRKPEADWLGWALHFGFGFVLGAIISFFCLFMLLGYGPFIQGDWHALFFLLGGALVAGGVSSYHGDRWWMEDYSRHFPPNALRKTRRSVLCSWCSTIAGFLMIYYYVIYHAGTS